MRTALFIDAANLAATTLAMHFHMDFQKLKEWVEANHELVSATYYTAVDTDENGNKNLQRLIDHLEYNGYRVIQKPTKRFLSRDGQRVIKGNMDVEICVDVLRMASKVEHIMLFSGDGDFRYLLSAVQDIGCKVTVVSSLHTRPPMVADLLRRQADDYIDLSTIRQLVEREM